MDDNSDDEGQAGDANEEEEMAVPKIITDDFFLDVCNATNATIKTLQGEQQYNLAEEFQKMLLVSQNLHGSWHDEQHKNAQMKDEVASAVGKVAAAFQISQTDQGTIERLKEEIESAWKQTDAALSREQAAQVQLSEIRDKFDKAQIQLKKAAKSDETDELGMTLAKHKDSILRERDRLNGEVEELNKRLQLQRIYCDEMERKRTESENKNKELYKLLDDTSSEAFKEKRLLDQLRIDLAEVTTAKDSSAEEVKHYKSQSETLHSANLQLNLQLQACNANLDSITRYHAQTNSKLVKTTTDLEEVLATRGKIHMELGQSNNLLKLKESECMRLFKENNQVVKNRDILQKKLMMLEVAKGDLQQEVIKFKNTIVTFEKERDANKKAFDSVKKFADDMLRERDLVRKDLQRATRIIGEQAEVIMLHEQHLKTLETEIKQHLETEQKQRSIIAKLEKERDKNAEEAQVLSDKVEQCQDDLLFKMNQIAQLNETIDEQKMKLAQVQQQFEAARSERNAFQRDLQATIEDRDDIRERLRLAVGQVEQLKEDVAVKEAELVRANKQIDKLEKDKIALKLEIQNTNIILQHTRTELKEKKIENERLYKTLSDDEIKLMKLRKDLDNTTNEKDLIGTQMIRRNDEIGLLNEKINIIQMALDRGEAQYNKRLDDIRLLKIEVGNLRSQRNLLTRGLANTADMRQEVLQLNRVVTQERVRSKALEQEMMTPMNIHRWRKLSGKDPDKMELISKVQALQKRILKLSVTAVDRENALQESENLYNSLKQFMTKLPDHTIKGKLNNTQRALTAKTKKLKALAAEVTSNQIDAKTKDIEIEEYRRCILETKQELLYEKKEKQKLRQLMISPHNSPYPNPSTKAFKTAGAGFRLPTTYSDD